MKTCALVLCAIAATAGSDANATVVTYPTTPGMNISGDYIVTVDAQSVPVYRGEGPLPYSFAYFDFSRTAAVKVTSVVRPLTGVRVLPESKGVIPSINGNVMTFTLTNNPTHLSIEPDAKNGPLLLFANPIEQNPPIQGAPGVMYFGPGLHKPNLVNLRDNQTLYVAGGAVLQAGVNISGNNIKIRGRGIIDGLPWGHAQGPQPEGGFWGQVNANNCTNMSMEGIILKDSWYSTVTLNQCDFVDVQNLKIVANRNNAAGNNFPDGFHYYNTKHLVISDSFIRTDDDCIAPIVSWVPTPFTDGLTVTRTSLWTDRAHIWRIGSGFQKLGVPSPAMRNLLFTDIDVLHYDPTWNPVAILMGNKDQPLENVRFENIRINHEGQLHLWKVQPWPATSSPIKNVYFKDIFVTGNANGNVGTILVSGPDAGSTVQDVTFENFVRHGQLTLRTSPGVTVGGFTSNINFIGLPPPRVPRSFGLVFAAFFLLVGLWRLLRGQTFRIWSLATAAIFLLLAFARPETLGPLNRLWTSVGLLLHRVISALVMAAIFYTTVTPIGLALPLVGKDPLRLRFDREATTYSIEGRPP